MKLTKIIAAVLCIAAVATACQQPFEEPMEQHGKAINLAVDVDNYTKATDTAFEEGDEIGLHIVPSGVYLNNAKYTYTEGALVSEQTNYWYMDETTESKIYAYYPYNENSTYRAAGYTFTVNADQSKEGGYTASDLMVAYTTSKPTAEAIELPFRHALSKIVIKIDNQLEEAIEDVYFSDIYGTATVRFDEVASTVSGSKGTIKTAKAVVGETAEEVYSLIVVPQENVSPKLIIKTATKQYTYQLAGNISFSAGKVSTAAITVSDESISTAFTPTISDWIGDNDLQFGQGEDYPGGGNNDNTGGGVVTSGSLYLHPGVWASDAPWFAAYFFNSTSGQVTMTMTDNDGDGVYECGVPEGMENVIFCRMNPDYTEFGWNVWENDQLAEEHVWNQTEDLTIGVEPDNHFFVASWDGGAEGKSSGVWASADFEFDPTTQASGLGVVGSFAASNWSDDAMLYPTETSGVLVAKDVVFRAYDAFKIRTAGTWSGEVNLGSGEVNYFKANTFFAVYAGGGDIIVEAAGTYDIYFDQNATKVYLMTAGVDYTTATEQKTDGNAPDASTMSWGLAGEHNGWGSGDTALVWDSTISMFVAKEATLGAEFKVRADESWTTNYGGAAITVDKSSATTLKANSSANCTITPGTYDVYFWHNPDNLKADAKIWVKTVGSAAPTL